MVIRRLKLAERAAMRFRLTVGVCMNENVCGGEGFKDAPLRSDHNQMGVGKSHQRVELHMHLHMHERPRSP